MKKQLSIFALLISLFLITSAQNLDSMLLLYYPFSGNANDASGNNYHGTVNNALLTDDRFGNPNSAYYFNGANSIIELPNISALKPPLPISLAFWIKLNDYSDENTRVLTTSYSLNSYHGISVNTHGGRVSVTYGDGSLNSTGPQNRRSKTGTTVLQLNQWYFVALVVRGANNMDIYINCVNDGGSYSGTGGSISYSTNPGSLGRYDMWNLVPSYFLGEMDEFRYWNRALTQADIDLMCAMNVDAGNHITICEGDSVVIGGLPAVDGGTPPVTWEWTPATGLSDPFAQNPTAFPSITTTYTIQATDFFGFVESDSITITVIPWDDASILPVTDYCDNHNIDTLLSIQTGGQWWGTGITDPISGEFSPTLAGAGTYTIFYGIPGLCGDTASVSINVHPAPVVNLAADTTVCAGDTLYFDAGAGANSYLWSNTETTQAITVTTSGIYSVTATNAFLCENSDDVEVTVLPWEDASILPVTDYCDNHNIDTLLSIQTGGQWWGTGITDPLSGEFSPTVAGAGTYTIFYGIPGLCGDTASVSINVHPAPVVNLAADTTVCAGDTLYFDAGAGADSYIWSNADTTQIIAVGASGVYSVTVTNAFLCQDSDDVEVTVLPWADATINPVEPLCANDASVLLEAAQTGGQWFGNGITNSATGLFNPFAAGNGTHIITYTIPGLCGDQDTSSIIVWPYPHISGTGQKETCIDANDGWAFAFVSGGTNPYSILWSNGDESDTITNLSPGTYECFVIDANGCRNHLIILIEESTDDCYPPHIYVPNIFSPNGDGENDVLYVRGEGVQYIQFIIYNRWGERIFSTNDIHKGWDGTYKGKFCDPAVFTYYVNAIFTNGENLIISGTITLVK